MRSSYLWLGLSTALVFTPTPAVAHDGLQRSSPAKDAVLTSSPAALRLTFSNPPNLRFARVQLLDSANAIIPLGALDVDSVRTLVAPVVQRLCPGRYTVVWQIAGADGHPVRGRFSFAVAGDAPAHRGGEPASNVPAPGADAPPATHHPPADALEADAFDAESPAYVVVRWLTFIALLLVIGAFAFQTVVLPLARRRGGPDTAGFIAAAHARSARIGFSVAVLLLGASLMRLFLQSYAMHGGAGSFEAPMIRAMILQTVWGWGWMLQVGATILALFAFRAQRSGKGWAFGLLAVATLALAATPALSGHAVSATELKALAIAADALHVLGASGWLGSLAVVLAAGIPAALALQSELRGKAAADLINAFSPTALVFAGLAGATGLFSAWLHLERLGNVWGTAYGRVLLLKLAVLSIVGATGAYNWLRVRPALGGRDGAALIRRSAGVEVAIAVVVLLITAILVATPTPMDMPMPGK
jgi:putative copper export protein/methionine-rich copper-binding protein CopC